MDRFTRIFRLHQLLRSRRLPVSHKTLEERLECSRASVTRVIRELRDYLGAPIEYDRERNGYFYEKTGEHSYELPGLWFSADELLSLLTLQRLLGETQPGFLDGLLEPLRGRIGQILEHQHLGAGEITRRVRILRMAGRGRDGGHFQTVAGAVLQRRRLAIRYHGRSVDRLTDREISPQRIAHYRDNWYLDAWCHRANELRTFAVERIVAARLLPAAVRDVPESALDEHFASAYGIFAGRPKETAVLCFTPERARWVADEHWHPHQEGRFLEDGSYELRVPYSDHRELLMDILKYGSDVEVVAPERLREEAAARLRSAAGRYA